MISVVPTILDVGEAQSYGFFKVATKASCSDAQGLFKIRALTRCRGKGS